MRRAAWPLAGLVAICLALPAASQARGHKVSVMTRNLYLGADLSPGVGAKNPQQLSDAGGQILNQVDQNNFPVRAKGLAREILKKQPDLVGLQEAALWRTGPCEGINPPMAAQVRYDYVDLLLGQLNRGKRRYKLVFAEPEFDFESWANTDGNESTTATGCPPGGDMNARLTMRDAILVRLHAGVQARQATGGHYQTLLEEKLSGLTVDVNRGWVQVNVRVRGSRPFHFVDTHLEALDNLASNPTNQGTKVGNGEIREAQAKQLVGSGGAATGRMPVILVGDLNSDVRTPLKPGDSLADQAILSSGFRERSTYRPLSCCLDTPVLTLSGGGNVSQFNHKVDHVMTNAPRTVKLIGFAVTGRTPVNGYWDSDHAGIFSTLRIP